MVLIPILDILFEKAYAKNPQNAYTMRLLSGVSIELGYVDESIELMKAADFSNADNVERAKGRRVKRSRPG